MKATFEHSVDVLVKAYLNDTLEHSNCCACAVGNLVADGLGKSFIATCDKDETETRIKWSTDDSPWSMEGWPTVFMTENRRQSISEPNYFEDEIAKEQIDSTGYKWQELARIEFAFETAPKGSNEDEWMFNGLMAVVEVLAEIHGVDLEAKEKAKLMFNKA